MLPEYCLSPSEEPKWNYYLLKQMKSFVAYIKIEYLYEMEMNTINQIAHYTFLIL